jgi:DNA-binding MarR family transcriptional regulator
MNPVKPPKSVPSASTRIHPHIGVLLERLNRRLNAASIARFQREGFPDLREGHRTVFVYLPEGGARLTDLAKRARITKQSMGALVRELEDLGYLERRVDPTDARARIITFTERGQRANDIGVEEILATEEAWAREVGATRMKVLRETLERLTRVPREPGSARDSKR